MIRNVLCFSSTEFIEGISRLSAKTDKAAKLKCELKLCFCLISFCLISFVFCLLLYYCRSRPAMIHFSTIQYVSWYSCQDMIHDTICYMTTVKLEGYCLVSCSWAQKSVQLTSLVGSMHAFVVSDILNISGRRVSNDWRQCFPMFVDAYVNVL